MTTFWTRKNPFPLSKRPRREKKRGELPLQATWNRRVLRTLSWTLEYEYPPNHEEYAPSNQSAGRGGTKKENAQNKTLTAWACEEVFSNILTQFRQSFLHKFQAIECGGPPIILAGSLLCNLKKKNGSWPSWIRIGHFRPDCGMRRQEGTPVIGGIFWTRIHEHDARKNIYDLVIMLPGTVFPHFNLFCCRSAVEVIIPINERIVAPIGVEEVNSVTKHDWISKNYKRFIGFGIILEPSSHKWMPADSVHFKVGRLLQSEFHTCKIHSKSAAGFTRKVRHLGVFMGLKGWGQGHSLGNLR